MTTTIWIVMAFLVGAMLGHWMGYWYGRWSLLHEVLDRTLKDNPIQKMVDEAERLKLP